MKVKRRIVPTAAAALREERHVLPATVLPTADVVVLSPAIGAERHRKLATADVVQVAMSGAATPPRPRGEHNRLHYGSDLEGHPV